MRLPKAEATELAPEAIGAGPPTAIKTRVVPTGRRRGPSCKDDLLLLVKLPSGGFGPYSAKVAGLARRTKWFSISVAEDSPQRRTGAIEETLHPTTLASRVVIFAYRFTPRRLSRDCGHAALTDL